jgi:membrane-associated protein
MNEFIQWLLTVVLLYKYVAIFGILIFGGFVTPYPAGIVIVAAAFFSTQGYLSFPLVLASALLGSIVGDQAGYWLSRRYGVPILRKIGLGRAIDSAQFRSFEAHLAAHPIWTIFLSRFSFTQIVNILAGIANVRYRTFFIVSVVGEILDVIFLVVCGILFGGSWTVLFRLLGIFGTSVTILLVLVILLAWKQPIRHAIERRRRSRES